DLKKAIAENTFRSDLFYRLSVFPLTTPPLRERKEDIPLLVGHFLKYYCPKLGTKEKSLSREAMQKLQAYEWPGNIRELENRICQAILLSPGETITPAAFEFDVGPIPIADQTYAEAKREALDIVEMRYLRELLFKTKGVISKAAEIAGLHRNTFWRLMRKHGIRVEEFQNQRP
ncbi:MAG: sigma-54-dependent Fis family transcriptional regulator, partial [Candidatus Coatesbacteria bacterium]|nr:sigma-54-dependent Fis family transcriptional regulator [Candidatus Coatesbacteria bacterium]